MNLQLLDALNQLEEIDRAIPRINVAEMLEAYTTPTPFRDPTRTMFEMINSPDPIYYDSIASYTLPSFTTRTTPRSLEEMRFEHYPPVPIPRYESYLPIENRWNLTPEQIQSVQEQDLVQELHGNLNVVRRHLFTFDPRDLCQRACPVCYTIRSGEIFANPERFYPPLTNNEEQEIGMPLSVSATFDWRDNPQWNPEALTKIRAWILSQLKEEYLDWDFSDTIVLYVNGRPVLVRGGYWENQAEACNVIYVGIKQRNVDTRQFEISTTMAIADMFGFSRDPEVLEEFEKALARMLSGIVLGAMSKLFTTDRPVSKIAINGAQMAVLIEGTWRSPNGSEIEVAGSSWTVFDYRQ